MSWGSSGTRAQCEGVAWCSLLPLSAEGQRSKNWLRARNKGQRQSSNSRAASCGFCSEHTTFAVPDKGSLLGSILPHTANRGWSLTWAGNLDWLLWFVFCASRCISKAQPSLTLSVYLFTALLSISLTTPSLNLQMLCSCNFLGQLISEFYYPRCQYILCMLVFWLV